MSDTFSAPYRVLLINPNRMKPATAPLALDYLGEALQRQGFTVDLLDLCFSDETIRDVDGYFNLTQPDLVGVTLRNTDDVYFASQDFCLEKYREIVDYIRERTDTPVVLGGSGFSIAPEAVLDYFGLDLGVWGEGEYALPLLAKTLAAGGDLSEVPGLVYRVGNSFLRNAPAYIDFSGQPALRRDIVDNLRYFNEGGMAGIESKRGCTQQCTYCADPLGKGTTVRLRPPVTVVEEIQLLLDRGIDHFHFCDSEFNLPAAHAAGVCAEIVRRGLGGRIRWYAYASPAPFSSELAALFASSGCAGVDFGADSGSDRMLRGLGRHFSVEDLTKTARLCHEYGLVFMYDLLLGGPGETRDSIKETIDMMKRLSPHRVGVSLGVRLFPGTRLAAQVKAQGSLVENPNLKGRVVGNESLLAPVFYLSADLGLDAESYVENLIGGDERFLFASREAGAANYNYNDNSLLEQAIKEGYRGAYWDILRRLAEGSG